MTLEQQMFTTDLVNLYNSDIFKTSLYIYIFQDEKCRLMRNLSLSMDFMNTKSLYVASRQTKISLMVKLSGKFFVLFINLPFLHTLAKQVEFQPF